MNSWTLNTKYSWFDHKPNLNADLLVKRMMMNDEKLKDEEDQPKGGH